MSEYRGQLKNADDVLTYITGGRGKVTVVSSATGVRFTYRFKTPSSPHNGKTPIFVSVLRGENNETDYTWLGCLWGKESGKLAYRHARPGKSRVTPSATSVRALDWVIKRVSLGHLPTNITVYHEGVCCRCGRTLTVPESVENGIGPTCRKIRA